MITKHFLPMGLSPTQEPFKQSRASVKNFSLCLIQKEAACFLFELERTASPIGLGRTSNLTGAESIAIEETVLFSRDSAALYFYIYCIITNTPTVKLNAKMRISLFLSFFCAATN